MWRDLTGEGSIFQQVQIRYKSICLFCLFFCSCCWSYHAISGPEDYVTFEKNNPTMRLHVYREAAEGGDLFKEYTPRQSSDSWDTGEEDVGEGTVSIDFLGSFTISMDFLN